MSGSKKGDARDRGTAAPALKAPRNDKATPVGRALRSVYDDTLRESVPDDFMDLLRKLD